MDIGHGNTEAGDDARPFYPHMHPQPVKGLPHQGIFAKGRLSLETAAAVRSGKLTDRHRKAANNGKVLVIGYVSPHVLPQPLFEAPQVGRLAHKRGAMQPRERWEEVGIRPSEVGKQSTVLGQTQVFPPTSMVSTSLTAKVGSRPRSRKRWPSVTRGMASSTRQKTAIMNVSRSVVSSSGLSQQFLKSVARWAWNPPFNQTNLHIALASNWC